MVPAAVGVADTIIVEVLVEDPLGPVTVNVIVFVPVVFQEIECGPTVDAVTIDAPDPKFHA